MKNEEGVIGLLLRRVQVILGGESQRKTLSSASGGSWETFNCESWTQLSSIVARSCSWIYSTEAGMNSMLITPLGLFLTGLGRDMLPDESAYNIGSEDTPNEVRARLRLALWRVPKACMDSLSLRIG